MQTFTSQVSTRIGALVLCLGFWQLGSCGGTSSTAQAPTAAASVTYDAEFQALWRDGNAELAGYSLVTPRYGQLRRGTAVTITVTEPFRSSPRVKADQPGGESFDVLKLNLIEDFQTGVYDYNLMTSAFIATEPVGARVAGMPTKLSFSSQEWCGHVYAQVVFGERDAKLDSHSYFEQEADEQRTLTGPRDGVSEDGLLLWARGLAAPQVAPGQQLSAPMLRSLSVVRLQHVPLVWDQVELTRHAAIESITTAAGTFNVQRSTARVLRTTSPGKATTPAPVTWNFYVETDGAHRIVKWTRDDGQSAELLRGTRLPYWQLHDEGHERHLQDLGLHIRPPATP